MKLREFLTQFRSLRLVLLACLIVTLTFVHQFGNIRSSPFSQIIDVLPYLLIILGALWFGLAGGITCALLTSVCYTTHLLVHEGGGLLGENLHRTLNILMFNVVGLVTGYLAQRQFEATERYRQVARELERSYGELRRRTEELLHAEEHLQRANRLSVLGELTAGVAHEIGNPLGGIKGIAEILADGRDSSGGTRRYAELLLKEVERLDAVVSRFLDSVRPSPSLPGRARVREILDHVVSLCQQSLGTEGIDLTVEVDEGLPPVASDPHQLQQVLLNLLLNAIQATPRGGRIRIAARRREDRVELRVADTGRGIPRKDLPRLFDPFFTTRPGGTGLGLAITHRIVQSCGGRIDVESEPGQGTAFTVSLPVPEDADAPGAARPQADESCAG